MAPYRHHLLYVVVRRKLFQCPPYSFNIRLLNSTKHIASWEDDSSSNGLYFPPTHLPCMKPDVKLLCPRKPATGSHPLSAKFISNCLHPIYLRSILILFLHFFGLFTACSITDSNTTCLERSSYTFYTTYVSILLYAYTYGCLCLICFS